ncbi:MAG: hypothetical protein JSS20_09410 [Proteobacteria bacterium]|nr:hypothetical protein [Pseudomonadota bacterium]
MIKTVALGLWICIVTIGGAYFGASWEGASNGADQKAARHPVVTKLKPISVPVVRDEKIAGYVLVHFSYLSDDQVQKKGGAKPDPFLIDAIFREIYNSKAPNLSSFAKEDWEGVAKRVRDTVNKRFGTEVVQDVLLDEFGFLPTGAVRKDLSPPGRRKDNAKAEGH